MLKVLALPVTVPILQVAQTDGTLVTVLMLLASQAPTVMLISIAVLVASPTSKLVVVEQVDHHLVDLQLLKLALILILLAKSHTQLAKVNYSAKMQLTLAIILIIHLTLVMQIKLLPITLALLLLHVLLVTLMHAQHQLILLLEENCKRISKVLLWTSTHMIQVLLFMEKTPLTLATLLIVITTIYTVSTSVISPQQVQLTLFSISPSTDGL